MLKAAKVFAVLAIAVAPMLVGCGTYIPEIQEVTQNEEQGKALVQAVITNVTCEVRDAVSTLYATRATTFMDDWGAQINLILTIEEQSSVAPNVSWFPNRIFSLGAGVGATGDATRIEKINSYYTVAELKKKCRQELRPGGDRLMESDLKLKEWLSNAVTAGDTGEIKFANSAAFKASGVLSHEVKFLVTTTGSLSPAWKLSRVISVNPVGTLFSTRRDRTHDLIITFGPTDGSGTHPGTTALNTSLASEIGASINTSIGTSIGTALSSVGTAVVVP